MFHHLRSHTNKWKPMMKSTALRENNQILLFFVSIRSFCCLLDCDSYNVSCLWTAIVFCCFTGDYGSNSCLYYGSHLRVFQVESISFYTVIKVVEFFNVCVGHLLFFFGCTIGIIITILPHNCIIEILSFTKSQHDYQHKRFRTYNWYH